MADKPIVDTRDEDKKDSTHAEALARARDAAAYEQLNRAEGREDLEMLASRNHWPATVLREREEDARPCLVVNHLPSFTSQVTNDSRLNKLSIKVKPHGGGATRELADLYNGIIRGIEADSNASVAYQTGLEGGVNNGFGYFRVTDNLHQA